MASYKINSELDLSFSPLSSHAKTPVYGQDKSVFLLALPFCILQFILTPNILVSVLEF